MTREQCELYIHEALERIPPPVRERIENVAFVIEDEPRHARQTEREIKSHGILLGLYQGVPLPARSAYYSGVLPDKITIFKDAIEQVAGPYPERIRQQVHEVVFHEVAHYLGMDETAVRRWERRRHDKKSSSS